ncbi:MAG TPA: hypothetical protein VME66_13125 [Candidatus Acidoferrales bacterium]|nr:hypothetical protein [Candidatus Acidoferrales bacterium]
MSSAPPTKARAGSLAFLGFIVVIVILAVVPSLSTRPRGGHHRHAHPHFTGPLHMPNPP